MFFFPKVYLKFIYGSFTEILVNNEVTLKLAIERLLLRVLLHSDANESESLIVYTLREIAASKATKNFDNL